MKPVELALLKTLVNNIPKPKDGLDGKDGVDGLPGLKGEQGELGKRGTDGLNGIAGKDGKDGSDGLDGKDGRDGLDGTVGKRGADGLDGPSGPKGKDGTDGTDGTDGKDGRGIKSVKVNEKSMLVVTYDDGEMAIAGKVSVTNKTEVIQNGAGLPVGHFAIYSVTIDDDNQLIVRCNNNKTFVVPTLRPIDIGGFVDYNDTSSAASPITLTTETWTDLPNNGLGAFTNLKFPTGVANMLDAATGSLLVNELPIGSSILIRMDYTVTPNSNNSNLKFRYKLGSGAGEYTLEKSVGKLDEGSGVPYRHSLTTDYIYIGDDNTRLGPIQPQIKLSGAGTVVNAGMAIEIRKG